MAVAGHLYLVVDACVLKAAGGKSEHPRSKHCRAVLKGILDNGHYVVLTTEIRQEWNRHCSDIGWKWRAEMISRRKLVALKIPRPSHVRTQVLQHAPAGVQHVIVKDIHLVEAALEADRIIFSLDVKARGHFARLTPFVSLLRDIVWLSPELEYEICNNCLQGQMGEVDEFALDSLFQKSMVRN